MNVRVNFSFSRSNSAPSSYPPQSIVKPAMRIVLAGSHRQISAAVEVDVQFMVNDVDVCVVGGWVGSLRV